MQREVSTPNPDYPIPANLWDLNIPYCAQAPSPLSTFIRHCNTMQSPHYPTYSKQGVREPAESITDLNRSTSSIENLRELQKYSEKLSYESTCCRLWAEGIQTQIEDEQERVHQWIEGMTEDLLRARRNFVCSATLEAFHGESIAASHSECSTTSSVLQLSIYGAG